MLPATWNTHGSRLHDRFSGRHRKKHRERAGLCAKLNPTYANFNIVTPYPGTPFFAAVKEQIADFDFSKFDVYQAVLEYRHLTPPACDGVARTVFRAILLPHALPSRERPLTLALAAATIRILIPSPISYGRFFDE